MRFFKILGDNKFLLEIYSLDSKKKIVALSILGINNVQFVTVFHFLLGTYFLLVFLFLS